MFCGRIILTLFILLLSQSVQAATPLQVFVSIVPQKYFVQQIGKDLVAVDVMVQPGASPHTYEPKPRQMARLSRARVYFSIGVPFENTWLKKFASANPKLLIVHTAQGIEKKPISSHHHDHHDHHEKNDLVHGILDPHIWLSPPLAKRISQSMLAAFQEIDPINKGVYQTNFDQFVQRIGQLDSQLRLIFSGKKDLQFMVFHPAWGYFARTYGLEQVPVEVEGKDPKPGQLKELIAHAREREIKMIFVQPQFSDKSARLVAREIGGQVTTADPLAEDWMANLKMVAEKFEAALK